MDVVRIQEARSYEAAGHAGFRMLRLQGLEATPAVSMWIGLSTIAPGGSTILSASGAEKIYIVIDGQVTVSNGREEIVLGALDSCRIAPDEPRKISNEGSHEARLLLAMQIQLPSRQDSL